MLNVHAIQAFSDNYIWALKPDNDDRIVIVDPGEAAPVKHFLVDNKLTLGAILITHHHPDHTGGINDLLVDWDVPVYGPAHERHAIEGLTARLAGGDHIDIDWLGTGFDVIDVPGHTAGHIALFGGNMLFSGDTLFLAGCGRLFEGSAAQMRVSMEALRNLPDDTRIYCGHEYSMKNLAFAAAVEPDNTDIIEQTEKVARLREENRPSLPSTIAVEKAINPFMRWDHSDVIMAAGRKAGAEVSDPDQVFAIVREWKDNF